MDGAVVERTKSIPAEPPRPPRVATSPCVLRCIDENPAAAAAMGVPYTMNLRAFVKTKARSYGVDQVTPGAREAVLEFPDSGKNAHGVVPGIPHGWNLNRVDAELQNQETAMVAAEAAHAKLLVRFRISERDLDRSRAARDALKATRASIADPDKTHAGRSARILGFGQTPNFEGVVYGDWPHPIHGRISDGRVPAAVGRFKRARDDAQACADHAAAAVVVGKGVFAAASATLAAATTDFDNARGRAIFNEDRSRLRFVPVAEHGYGAAVQGVGTKP